MLRYPPMTEVCIYRGQRWIILAYTPTRRWFFYITLIYSSPPPCLPFKNHFGSIFYIPAGTSYLPDNCASRTKIYNQRSEVDHYSINTNKEMVFYITLIYSPQHYFFWLPKYNETRYCVYCSTWLLQMIQKVTSTRSKV